MDKDAFINPRLGVEYRISTVPPKQAALADLPARMQIECYDWQDMYRAEFLGGSYQKDSQTLIGRVRKPTVIHVPASFKEKLEELGLGGDGSHAVIFKCKGHL